MQVTGESSQPGKQQSHPWKVQIPAWWDLKQLCLGSLMRSSQAGPTSDAYCFVPVSRLVEIFKTRNNEEDTFICKYLHSYIHLHVCIKAVASCMKSKPCKQILIIIIWRNASGESIQTQLISVEIYIQHLGDVIFQVVMRKKFHVL